MSNQNKTNPGKSVKPLVISMGDPGGIGAEVIVKAVNHLITNNWPAPLPIICGDLGLLRSTASNLNIDINFTAMPATNNPDASDLSKTPLVVSPSEIDLSTFRFGEIMPENGLLAVTYLRKAVDLVESGQASGLVTAPLNKAALAAAGIEYPGHTEMLAEWSKTTDFAMMLMGSSLKVVLVTRHVPLRDIFSLLTPSAVLSTLRISHAGLQQWFGIAHPRIAVAGINPHAGESGTIGNEEIEILEPAIEAARKEGIDASGPHSPDTVYAQASQGRFDVVIAPYHDQGLVPLKLLHFDDGVNVTLGLPFIRTSPDHGTAFDIVGKGIASENSMLAAINTAKELAETTTAKTS